MTRLKTDPHDPVKVLRDRVTGLEQKVADLTRRETQLRQIIDLVPDAIFANDWDGRYLIANKRLAELLGTSVEKLQGALSSDFAVSAEQYAQILSGHRQVMESGQAKFVAEQRVVDGGGEQHILQIRRIPYNESQTGSRAVLGVATDITHHKQIEQKLLRSRDAVIFGLAKLAESRDDETGRHLERICRYVEILCRHLADLDDALDDDWVATMTSTAALHDIGKVGIPDAVLLKPGPLTGEQRQTIQKHTTIGGDTMLAIKQRWGDDAFLVAATQIAFAHHERWDGGGYPFGLAGETIPLPARIVAVADVYDALTTKRVYKPKMSHEHASRLILEGTGKHFDPQVVEAFAKTQGPFQETAEQLQH